MNSPLRARATPKITMLSTPAEFERCLRRTPTARAGAFALHVALPLPEAGPLAGGVAPSWRLGLVIPKRYEASAVARNTIKRRWRAAFAGVHVASAREFGAADVVVRMQGPLIARSAPAETRLALAPAKRRARQFDPQALLGSLVERLRRPGSPSGSTTGARRTIATPS